MPFGNANPTRWPASNGSAQLVRQFPDLPRQFAIGDDRIFLDERRFLRPTRGGLIQQLGQIHSVKFCAENGRTAQC